jgi:hypothetical protein
MSSVVSSLSIHVILSRHKCLIKKNLTFSFELASCLLSLAVERKVPDPTGKEYRSHAGDELFRQMATQAPFNKLDPRVASFFKEYLIHEKAIRFQNRLVINTTFPPIPAALLPTWRKTSTPWETSRNDASFPSHWR